MSRELKQCPFCPNMNVKLDHIYGTGGTVTIILCDTCGATVSFRQRETESKTVEAWNRRVQKDV